MARRRLPGGAGAAGRRSGRRGGAPEAKPEDPEEASSSEIDLGTLAERPPPEEGIDESRVEFWGGPDAGGPGAPYG